MITTLLTCFWKYYSFMERCE